MTLFIQNSFEDYLKYLSEYALQNRTNRILMFTGLFVLMAVTLAFMYNNYELKSVHIFFLVVGIFIYLVPRIHFFNDKRKLKTASYLADILAMHEITLNENHILFKKGDDLYETRKRDIYQFYELTNFYVISINELHHFPIPKTLLNTEQVQFIRKYFEMD